MIYRCVTRPRKAKYGGIYVSEAKWMKQFEDENARLKKLCADQILETAALKSFWEKKW